LYPSLSHRRRTADFAEDKRCKAPDGVQKKKGLKYHVLRLLTKIGLP